MPYLYYKTKEINTINKIISHYLYEITFSFPDHIKICNLAQKINDELVFLRNGNGWYWGCEIELAIKLGAFITYERVRKYKKKKIFEEYINDLYKKRQVAKQTKNEILNELFKKLLNSLYGKFGQKLRNQSYIEKYDTFLEENLEINNMQLLDESTIYIEYKDNFSFYHNIGSLIRLSSYITAFARCTLLNPILNINHDNVLYMDTDSLFLKTELNPIYLDNNTLGKFKKEIYEGGIFISSKNYMLLPNTIKMKGVNIKNVTKQNYLDLLNQKYTFVKTTTSTKQYGNVKISETNKLITAFSYKREYKGMYNYPHKNKHDYLEYKIKQLKEKELLNVKTKSIQSIRNPLKTKSNLILKGLNDCINIPIILNHNDNYNNYDINTYLKHRILSFHPKAFTLKEKEFIYNEIYKNNEINMRLILLKLYGFNDKSKFVLGKNKLNTLKLNGYCKNWKLNDIGILKQMFIEYQYNYIKNLI